METKPQIEGRMFNRELKLSLDAFEFLVSKRPMSQMHGEVNQRLLRHVEVHCEDCVKCPNLHAGTHHRFESDRLEGIVYCSAKAQRHVTYGGEHADILNDVVRCPDAIFDLKTGREIETVVSASTPTGWPELTPSYLAELRRDTNRSFKDEYEQEYLGVPVQEQIKPKAPPPRPDIPKTVEADVW